jgi:RimJ/RimL family protein N-acetyltransferase
MDLVRLLEERTIHVRSIASSDTDALVAFHEGLTSETTRMRFFVMHPHLTPAELERFTHVDHHDREALVALDGSVIVAVARFDRLPGTDEAEIAFVVADGWQGKRLGTELLAQLAERGRAEGVTHFTADTLCENHRMLDVFRASGLTVKSEAQAGVVHVVLDLGRGVRA